MSDQKATDPVSVDQLSLSGDEQDAVVFGILTNEEFVAQCQRRNIKPEYFTGESRQLVVSKAYGFYTKYQKPPADTILDLFSDDKRRKKLRAEKHELVDLYLTELSSKQLKPNVYLLDRLDEFVRRRVAFTAATAIISKMGTVEYEPELIINTMRAALNELDECTCKSIADDMRDDELITQVGDIVTSFGIEAIDEPLGGGLHLGQFTVIQAFTSRGKSQSIIHLAKRAVRSGNSCLVVPTEMINRTWRRRWKQSVTGLTLTDLAAQPKFYQQQRQQVFRRHSSVYLLAEEEKSMAVDSLASVIDEIKQRDGREIKLILLDSADDMNPPKSELKNLREKIERSTATYTYLKNLAKDRNLCIVTTSQSQRGAAKRWWATADSIGDDINKVRKAHVGISLNAKDSELNKGYLRIMLFKHTDGPVGAKCWVKNAYDRGQFAYYSEPYVHELYNEIMKKEGVLTNE